MKNYRLIILLLILVLSGCSKGYNHYLEQAEHAYASGDKELAKDFYSKAADKGSPEAHFALAYKYHVTPEESVYHFTEAAKKGHEKALDYALDALLFRANSLKIADPQRALQVYKQAKKANPSLKLYDEEIKLKTIQMCVEPGKFDAEAFCKKYNLQPENDQTMYHVWQIAEEVSRGGRFGKPDSKLILHLVARGGWAPAELEYAVEEAYKNWKNGEAKEFNICDHITSGGGMGFCASRMNDEDKKDREAKLIALEEKLGEKSRPLLRNAYDLAVKFIEAKASNEEGHGGSGITAWILGSKIDQKNEYLKLMADIQEGFNPSPENGFDKADQLLNETYKKVIQDIKARSKDNYYLPSVDELREIQRLWIPYRDASVKLFVTLNPSIDEAVWKSWLTEVRKEQLKVILSL
ncbi:MAG: lysozyme inhibitor LprI family protein [Candidatus Omnitrophota bacterium]